MPNPIPYQSLFDLDGLRAAIIETEAATDAYGKAAQADFDLIGKSVDVLKGKLLDVGAILNKPIKLTDDAGQQQVVDLSKQVADLTVQIKQQQIAIDAFNSSMLAQKQVISDAKTAEAEYSAQLKKSKLDEQDVKVAIAEHTLALKQLALANKQNGTDTNTLISPYKQLSQQLTATRNTAKDMAAQLVLSGATLKEALGNETVQAAVKNVGDLDKVVKGIDSSFGQSQRNVGNYGDAFGKAFGYLRTAAYILPGIGIAGIFNLIGEGILAAADKLDLFSEKLSQGAKNAKALNDVYKESDVEAGKQITNLQYLYKAATDVTNSTKDRLLAVNELQREFPNYFKNISDETILNGGAKKSYDELSDSIIENARALAAAGKIAELRGKILDTDITKQKILNKEGNDAIKLANDIKSGKFDQTGTGEQGGAGILADDQAKKNHDNAVKAIKDQDDLAKGYEATIKVIEKVAGGATKLGNALAGKSDNTPKDKPATADQSAILNEQLKAIKNAQDTVLATEKTSYDAREDAVNKFEVDSINLIQQAENKKIITVRQANNLRDSIGLESAKNRTKIESDAQRAITAIFRDGVKDQQDATAKTVTNLKDALDSQLLLIESNKSDAELALTQQYAQGLINEKQYNEQIKNIDNQANADRLNAQILAQQKIVDVLTDQSYFGIVSEKDVQRAKDELTKLKIALSSLGIKVAVDDNKAYQASLDEIVKSLNKASSTLGQFTGNSGLGSLFGDLGTDLVKGIGKADEFEKTAQLGMDAVGAYTDYAINASKARVKALQDEADHDISLAGDNAEAKQKIQDAYNKKIAEEQNKQARLQKAAAVVDIAINTAVAISKTLATTAIFGIPLIPIIAALGALEIGLVLAQPTPQYATGRNGGPAELAEVNERGPELIGQKGKYRFANRGMRGFVKLNAGDEVKTAMDTKMMLANGMITADGEYVTNVSQSRTIYDKYIMASNQQTGIDYGRMQDAVAGGVSGLPVSEHHWNENGYQQNTRIKNTRIMDVNRRNRF